MSIVGVKYKDKYRTESLRLKGWDYKSCGTYFITISTKHKEHFFGKIENGEMILKELGKIVSTEWLRTVELRPDMNLKLENFVVMPNHFHAIIRIGKNPYNQLNLKFNKDKNSVVGVDDSAVDGEDSSNYGEDSSNCGEDFSICGEDSCICGDAMHCVSADGKDIVESNNLTATDMKDIVESNNVISTDGKGIVESNNLVAMDDNDLSSSDVLAATEIKEYLEKMEKILESKILKKGYRNKFGPQSKNVSSVIRGFKSSVTTKARKMGNNQFEWQSLYYDSIVRTEREFYIVQKYIKNNPKNWVEKF